MGQLAFIRVACRHGDSLISLPQILMVRERDGGKADIYLDIKRRNATCPEKIETDEGYQAVLDRIGITVNCSR